jgi:choline dehydrogenase
MAGETFDSVRVGAGSAGCALAARLARAPHAPRVLLLERGGRDAHVWIHVPLGVGKLLNDERWAWPFSTEPQPNLAGQRVYWPRGKVLGGSSAVNGMAYVWGDPAEYDAWAAGGLEGWSWADLQPLFARMECAPHATDPRRGRDGPVRITDRGAYDPDPLSDAYVQAWREAGVAYTPDYNAASYEGVRYLEQTQHRGRRWSAAVAYLRPARRLPNLVVRTGVLAERVRFDGRRACAVEYRRDDGSRGVAHAAREVVLCAGAVQSPQLLELSGVGDPGRLARLGIPLVAASPAVGEHMSDHLQVRCTYRTTRPITINDVMRSSWHRMRVGAQYLLTRRGLMSNTSSTAHAITRSDPALARPDVMVRIYHISGKDRYSRSATGGIDPHPGFSIGGFKLYPVSRGSIHAASPDAAVPPVIEPNYFADPADRATALRLLRLVRRVAAQPALAPWIVAEQRPGAGTVDDDALLDYARESGQTAWHTVGTCRMGPPSDAVVDARLRVHGVERLRVADISVMPTIASSNTNAPAMMIGEKAADLLLADAQSGDRR